MKIVKKHHGTKGVGNSGGMLPFMDYNHFGLNYTVFPEDASVWRYADYDPGREIDSIVIDRQRGGGWYITAPGGFEGIRFPSRRSALAVLRLCT